LEMAHDPTGLYDRTRLASFLDCLFDF
jgi:hypothetical protein